MVSIHPLDTEQLMAEVHLEITSEDGSTVVEGRFPADKPWDCFFEPTEVDGVIYQGFVFKPTILETLSEK